MRDHDVIGLEVSVGHAGGVTDIHRFHESSHVVLGNLLWHGTLSNEIIQFFTSDERIHRDELRLAIGSSVSAHATIRSDGYSVE